MLTDSHHDKVLVGVDVKHLVADAQRIIAGMLWSYVAFVVHIIPVEVIADVGGIEVDGLTYPFLAHDSFAVPHTFM